MKRIATRTLALVLTLALTATGCGGQAAQTEPDDGTATPIEQVNEPEEVKAEESLEETSGEEAETAESASTQPFSLTRDEIQIDETITDDADESHAILASGTTERYGNVEVVKTGDADGDEADFYGTNAAVYAEDGATLDLSDVIVSTDGTHANAVFSYGEGTVVNIANSIIETVGNCSGGIMVTGGGTLNATNLWIHTTGNSSAAIRSDRGGGTQNVSGGYYQTDGTGSPVIYSTADVTVEGATLISTASQGVVVEGKNSVTLVDCDLTASNTTKNSDKSSWYQAVMIYQSMSGDAAEGEASFSMEGGSLTNQNGDVLFVNNTVATVTLDGVRVTSEDETGVLLRAAAAGWGSEGSNGGHVNLTLANETIEGDVVVDDVSELNLHLTDGTTYTGAINAGDEGSVYVEIEGDSTWVLTDDSHIDALTCDADAIDLNGHTLYVDGVAYVEGTTSTGSAIEFTVSSGSGMGEAPDGMPGEPPSGGMGPGGNGGEPPAKPGD